MNGSHPNPESLKSYVSMAYLHPLTQDPKMQTVDGTGFADTWPRFGATPAMRRPPGSRILKLVHPLSLDRVMTASRQYFSRIPDVPVIWGNDSLNLPAQGIIELDEEAKEELTVHDLPSFSEALNASVLSTLEECMRKLADNEAQWETATFRNISHMRPVPGAFWDTYALPKPSTQPGETEAGIALVLLALPPGLAGKGDLIDFCEARMIPTGRLDQDREGPLHDPRRWAVYETIWAALYDACAATRCHFFAVTNYDYWALGVFSETKMMVQTFDLIPRPGVQDTRHLDHPGLADFNSRVTLFQMLLWWCLVARGQANQWPLPREDSVDPLLFCDEFIGSTGPQVRGWAPDGTPAMYR
ncbi:hypothetical protein GLOTRDRAFT_96253 [Gloeophyllum trabeum ATCC 11539]|uniref:Uncharacterized protein n=1 Tax=Gloeophyllum trabeum (strain ATCC 11539 / FP-39264 / Madison 617) TaxID=670483 RepID=S7PV63_GLOTA|nr:uncharacterized protein GLOTRDRAFT_96253 [Gloeophyllum trabeum ATCC 11539]EPQ51496.1 hypothetical protein GLOTRDRAFT_96253 [Gloeophyllum trabeum ATCC 11539]